jgi:hypothetical protein
VQLSPEITSGLVVQHCMLPFAYYPDPVCLLLSFLSGGVRMREDLEIVGRPDGESFIEVEKVITLE